MAPNPREATRVITTDGKAVARIVRSYRLISKGPDGVERPHEVAQAVMRAGAQAGNDMVLADEAVSRIHFEIVAEPAGFRLRDLGSTNGTFVDGNRVLDVYLKSGARIRAGRSQLVFELLDAESSLQLEESFGSLVGKSPAMREMFSTLRRVAASNTTVLIEGESGTGKELIAEAVHAGSPRAEHPFVVFDCSAIPSNLIESELFGHEKGAFTGAESKKIGRFEEAEGGTLFLDEIGELPLELQPKLLRVVESREYRPLGSDKVRRSDIRIIAATNRDLATEVNRSTFRHDLYYRIAVVRIAVPPLRSRLEDIPLLVAHFLRRTFPERPQVADEILGSMTPETWQRLTSLPWRGNVRELRNAVERAMAMGEDWSAEIGAGLGKEVVEVMHRAGTPPPSSQLFQDAKREVLARFEREYFADLWKTCAGNISEIARRSGMERAHVRGYLRRHGLDKK